MITSITNLYNCKTISSFYDDEYIKQILFYVLGFIIIIIFKKFRPNWLFKYSKILYYVNLFLLLLVLIMGTPINGTKAWFRILGFSIQPSEFMKISLTLLLITKSEKKEKEWKNILRLFIYTLLPSLLVFLEPDTGAIIFFLIIFLTICVLKKVKIYWYIGFAILISIISILFFYFYYNNQDVLIKVLGTSFFYRVDRLLLFKEENYQLSQGLIAVFSSPFFRNGINNPLIYIPEMATDFIFAFIVGNFGLWIILIIFSSYIYIIFYLLSLINRNKKTNYLIISFITMLIIQILINISMNIGLIPTIGITLPFLSYGGSSLLTFFIYIAFILSLTHYKDN